MKAFFDPLAVIWLAALGFVIGRMVKERGRCRRGVLLGLLGLLAFPLMEVLRLPARLQASLEEPYRNVPGLAELEVAGIDAVMGCGGVLAGSVPDLTGSDYHDSVDRFFTAVTVGKRLGCPVVWGGGDAGGVPESVRLRAMLESWGVEGVEFLGVGLCRDTRDEAVKSAALAGERGWRRVVLVTSAWHMKRAEAAYRSAGLEVVPVACDFAGMAAVAADGPVQVLPSSGSMRAVYFWLTELVGRVYYRWRGWL
jgi:uncharacterized SAM-binding protein YcdF (DUF218 family)